MKSNVGSKRMLPYRRNRYLREGAYDEPKELAGVDRGSSASLFETNKPGKKRIFDEFMACNGYHRKYAIRVFKHGPKPKGLKKPGRKKQYQGAVVEALTRIWEICGRICSKRLKPYLPEMVTVLEHHQELVLAQAVKSQPLQMNRATIDRCLKPARYLFRSNPELGMNGSDRETLAVGCQLQNDPLSGRMLKYQANCPFGVR